MKQPVYFRLLYPCFVACLCTHAALVIAQDDDAQKRSTALEELLVSSEDTSSSAMMNAGGKSGVPALTSDIRTTETDQLAVANTAELLKLLGVMPTAVVQEKKPSEKNQNLSDVAISETTVKEILGDSAPIMHRVVDEGNSLVDPMVVPWIRNAVILKETLDEANALLAEGKVSLACDIWSMILAKYPETDEAHTARESLDKIRQLRTAADAKIAATAETTSGSAALLSANIEIELDKSLKIDTIVEDINDPAGSYVMIGGRLYRPGEEILGYFPRHVISSVRTDAAEVEVSNAGRSKKFTIYLKPMNNLEEMKR